MVSRVTTVAFSGIDVATVDVQTQVSSGMVAFNIVGLPDKAVAESKERIRAAMHTMGFALPAKRITVNLSPADLQKEGSHYDLPILLSIMTELKAISQDDMMEYIVMGELALDGSITKVSGVLPSAIEAAANGMGIICPYDNGPEAVLAEELEVLAPKNLVQLINHLKGHQIMSRPRALLEVYPEEVKQKIDMADIKGQELAKRALEIAAAGGHNMLMIGPPGSGKSMLASRLSTILPPLSAKEALEVTMIHSLSGGLKRGGLITKRPYREPHHSASLPSIVGGGIKARPGEVSLAHNGVLFLDELPEFSRSTLESLRQPLEGGKVSISRANAHITYPARVQLIAAMNPCRCGYLSDKERACNKAPSCGRNYQAKISGPLFDRIDLHVSVPEVKAEDLHKPATGESSQIIAKRVEAARKIQLERFQSLRANVATNAEANGDILEKIAIMDGSAKDILIKAMEKFRFSARGYNRVLRVARTIADLSGSETIGKNHIAEAIGYRKIM